MRRKTDDDELFLMGTYNTCLNTQGYDVDATANKKIQADFPKIEGVEWIYDRQVKDYQTLLTNRRDTMTQTFRYILRQNGTPSGTDDEDDEDGDDADASSGQSRDGDDRPSPERQFLNDVANVARREVKQHIILEEH